MPSNISGLLKPSIQSTISKDSVATSQNSGVDADAFHKTLKAAQQKVKPTDTEETKPAAKGSAKKAKSKADDAGDDSENSSDPQKLDAKGEHKSKDVGDKPKKNPKKPTDTAEAVVAASALPAATVDLSQQAKEASANDSNISQEDQSTKALVQTIDPNAVQAAAAQAANADTKEVLPTKATKSTDSSSKATGIDVDLLTQVDGTVDVASAAVAKATLGEGGDGDSSTSDFQQLMDKAIGGFAKATSGNEEDEPSADAVDQNVAAAVLTATPNHQNVSTVAKQVLPQQPAVQDNQIAETNHSKILTGIQANLLPNGGSMQLKLSPPELGDLQITVHVRDGVMTAAFQTSNDDATKMLSHSLNQLKTTLESAGMNVEKLHVQQAPKQDTKGGGDSDAQQQANRQGQNEAKQEQQRKEMLQRMWRKLAGVAEPLDTVA